MSEELTVQPYPSWLPDEDGRWKAPVDMPIALQPCRFKWDEPNTKWIAFTTGSSGEEIILD